MKTTESMRCKHAEIRTRHTDVLLAVGFLVVTFIMASDQIWGAAKSTAKVVTYPAPAGEALSDDYKVQVEGRRIDVYMARVLDPPFAGKQWDHGGSYSFANFDMSGRLVV